ncbi:MAG: lysophospholipid acyltransferase family protein [Bradymonadia bacterium]
MHTLRFYLLVMPFSYFCVTAGLLFALLPGGRPIMRWFDRVLWSTGWCWLSRTSVELTGHKDALDQNQAYVFVSNHQSHFDIPTTKYVLRERMIHFVTKKSMLWVPITGWYLYFAGYPLIDRRKRHKALGTMQKAAQSIRGGSSLLVYPEGTRSADGAVKPFKLGAFVLAIETQTPIVPITVSGTRAIMPRGSFRVGKGHVKIHIGKAVEVDGFSYEDRDDLAAQVHGLISEQYACQS